MIFKNLIGAVLALTYAVPIVTSAFTLEAEDAVLSGPQVVNSGHAGFTGTGFVDYINAKGDRIEWTVDIPITGDYELMFRYALSSGNRPLEIQVNGKVVAKSLSFPATGAWNKWGNSHTTATLQAGKNTIRATAIGDSGSNVDSLTVNLIKQHTTPTVTSTRTLEAEDAVLSGPRVVNSGHAGFTGTGFVDYINPKGDRIEWTVDIPVTGDYELMFRYALSSGKRPLEIQVNGKVVAKSLSFEATGAWNKWENSHTTATLQAGKNTIRATAIGDSGSNVDSLTVKLIKQTSNVTPKPTAVKPTTPVEPTIVKISPAQEEGSFKVSAKEGGTVVIYTGKSYQIDKFNFFADSKDTWYYKRGRAGRVDWCGDSKANKKGLKYPKNNAYSIVIKCDGFNFIEPRTLCYFSRHRFDEPGEKCTFEMNDYVGEYGDNVGFIKIDYYKAY